VLQCWNCSHTFNRQQQCTTQQKWDISGRTEVQRVGVVASTGQDSHQHEVNRTEVIQCIAWHDALYPWLGVAATCLCLPWCCTEFHNCLSEYVASHMLRCSSQHDIHRMFAAADVRVAPDAPVQARTHAVTPRRLLGWQLLVMAYVLGPAVQVEVSEPW
jgi:hypothetical protein